MAKYPHGERVERQCVWGLGLEPPVVQRAKPLGIRGQSPLKLTVFLENNDDIWPQNQTIRYHKDGIFSRLQMAFIIIIF
jgi:hypothetical protein